MVNWHVRGFDMQRIQTTSVAFSDQEVVLQFLMLFANSLHSNSIALQFLQGHACERTFVFIVAAALGCSRMSACPRALVYCPIP